MALQGTLGFLGFGNMNSAILAGLLETGTLAVKSAAVYDPDPEKQQAAAQIGARLCGSAEELGAVSDVLLLGVKPQVMDDALGELKPGLKPGALVISIAAGVSTAFIQARLGADVRVARVMPNTPALVGAGAAGVTTSANCTPRDAGIAGTIFEAVGAAVTVPESAMDAVTALSGSGPAYFFYMVECLVKAAEAQGLGAGEARLLAAQTLFGAGQLLRESGESAATLRARVTSKGGTTEAALNSLAANGFEQIIAAAVEAAANRSKELGQ